MKVNLHSVWWPRVVTFVVAALVAASAVYWTLRWPGPAGFQATPVLPASTAPADPAALARLLGGANPLAAAAPPASASSRFVLLGVVAGGARGGAALISVDGKPARSYAVGRQLDESLLLQSVAPRRAVLAPSADGPAAFTLEMKPPPR